MATIQEVQDMRLDNSEDLCELAELLGYKQQGRFAINQLQCKNGAFASSLLNFFDDNPDAIEAVRDWVLQNCDLDDEEELEQEAEGEEDE